MKSMTRTRWCKTIDRMNEQKEEWCEVNVQKLSEVLAKRDWDVDTKTIPETELYNLSTIRDPVTGTVEIVKEVSEHWSSNFWALVEFYKLLILDHSKLRYDDKSESTKTEPDC